MCVYEKYLYCSDDGEVDGASDGSPPTTSKGRLEDLVIIFSERQRLNFMSRILCVHKDKQLSLFEYQHAVSLRTLYL